MELQEDSLERKRFIICYLSFYSSDISVYYSLKFIFVIDLGGKDRNYFGMSKSICHQWNEIFFNMLGNLI